MSSEMFVALLFQDRIRFPSETFDFGIIYSTVLTAAVAITGRLYLAWVLRRRRRSKTTSTDATLQSHFLVVYWRFSNVTTSSLFLYPFPCLLVTGTLTVSDVSFQTFSRPSAGFPPRFYAFISCFVRQLLVCHYNFSPNA